MSQPQEVLDNEHLAEVCPNGYTLKVTNSKDSKDKDFIEGQNTLLALLGE